MTHKIEVNDKTDRETLALILVKAGYTVKIEKIKVNTKYVNFVCYEMDGENKGETK